MTRPVTLSFQREAKKEAQSPVVLLEMRFSQPLGLVRLSDRDLLIPRDYDTFGAAAPGGWGWGGPCADPVQFRGLVASWPEEIDPRVSEEVTTADLGDLTLSIVNAPQPPFTDYFFTRPPEEAEVWIFQTFSDLPLTQRAPIFKGKLRDPIRWDDGLVTLDVVTGTGKDVLLGAKVTQAQFPAADPDAVGRVMPIIYGKVEEFPCLPVGVGAVDLLRESFLAGVDTVLKLSDASRFPSSGQVRVGSETLNYTGVDQLSDNLTGVTGASNDHLKGDVVWEVRGSYDFLVAAHQCKGVTDVRVNGLLVPASAYSLDLSGPTVIRFLSHPIGQFLSQHLHDVMASISSAATLRQFPTGFSGGGNQSWLDGDEESGAGRTADAAVLFSNADYGAIDTIYYWVLHDGQKSDTVYRNSPSGPLLGTFSTNNPGIKRWQRFADSGPGRSWSDDLFVGPSSTQKAFIYEVYREVVYTGAVATTEEGKQIPGLDFWRGALVTVTVEGKKDDAQGSITGTPNALIERPDHIVRDVLLREMGLGPGELDQPSFDASGSRYASLGFVLAGALTRQEEARRFLARVAFQARSWFFWDEAERANLVFREFLSLPLRALGRPDIVEGTLTVSRTPFDRVANRLHVHYGRDWRSENPLPLMEDSPQEGRLQQVPFRGLVTLENPDSQATFGTRVRSLFLDFVANGSIAQNLGEFYLWELSRPRVEVQLESFLPHFELERGDAISLTYGRLGLISQALEITRTSTIIGSANWRRMDRIRITAQGPSPMRPSLFGLGVSSEAGWGD